MDPPLLIAVKPTDDTTVNAWELLYYTLTSGIYIAEAYHQDSGVDNAKVEYIFEFPDTLVKADLPVDFVRLNAWEAYTGGTWDDVAAALQTHAGQITAGYANGNLVNFVFPWGKANTADPSEPQSDYSVYTLNNGVDWSDEESLKALNEESLKALNDESWTPVMTGSDPYDSRGGVYKVQQYFLYEEGGVQKRYPVARTAYLVVDPVKLTGAWAKDMEKTYRLSDAPTEFDNLRLPAEAILQTAPTLSKVSLTVPIQGWTPHSIPWSVPAVNAYIKEYSFTPAYAQGNLNAAARARYPWLTLGSANLGDATRTLVDDGDALDPEVAGYEMTVCHDAASHSLVLKVKKTGADGTTAMDIPEGSTVTAYMPGGVKIEPAWWGTPATGYTVGRVNLGDGNGYYQIELDTDQGDTTYADQLAQLTRYINLGGWFAVTVDEPAAPPVSDPAVSDMIYGYLSPRDNLHTQSYVGEKGESAPGAFDFTGYYAGLLPMYAQSVDSLGTAQVNPLNTTVVLPLGYTVATTYNGMTGDEPGALGTVKVAGWQTATADADDPIPAPTTQPAPPWTVAKGEALIVQHGADPFAHGAVYDAYGRVANPPTSSSAPAQKEVQINTEFRNTAVDPPAEKPVEKLEVYEGGSVVTNVVYDTRQQGYVVREERTLTLRNTGSTDVSGVWLDMDHAPYSGQPRGHFEILRAPASYLPVGGETTFVVTYVYNLAYYITDPALSGTTYVDKIAVSTNNTSAAATFTAQFRVTQGPVSPVEVVTIPTPDPAKPGGNLMGTAMVITGLGEGLPNPITDVSAKPSSTPGNTSYEEGYQYVWIQANPISEYTVKEVYYYPGNNSNNSKVAVTPYSYSGTDGAGEYYYFKMPGHRTTVYVEFEESVYAKLRLSSLLVYGGVEGDVTGTADSGSSTMIDAVNAQTRLYPLRRDDKATNALLTYPSGTAGAAGTDEKLTLTEEESSYPEFFSVLPASADYAQLSLTLRQTMEMLGLNGTSINAILNPVEVLITTPSAGGSGGDRILNMGGSTADTNGSTGSPPTTHTTFAFKAPAKGEEMVVTITLSYTDSALPAVPTTRSFQVRLVRLSGEGIQPPMGYGNSPFGMIMNDAAITDKDAAKAAFQAGNTFVGSTYIPAKASRLTNTYWTEAPAYSDGSAMVSTWANGDNYDRDDTALFVMRGEAFLDPGLRGTLKDSAGNEVELSKVSLSIKDVDLLDTRTSAKTQTARFVGNNKATVAIPEKLDAASTTGVAAAWAGGNALRPGVYQMTYTFTDYDGTEASFARPLIILTTVGDVNADGQATSIAETSSIGDEALLENRVTDPLGYTIGVDTWPWAELFRLRVCDGNNDRFINHIDANALRAKDLTPYYLPVDYK